MKHVSVLGIILAGGKGERLSPLTKQRSKPAVPFGGKYRIVDFVLSNFINSEIYSIYVLTQFKSQSLLQHLREGWQFSDLLKNQFIIPVPAQMRKGEKWYQGTSDAIFQNIHLLELASPELVAVFGADHIYRMDVSHMVGYHKRKRTPKARLRRYRFRLRKRRDSARWRSTKTGGFNGSSRRSTTRRRFPDARVGAWPRWVTTSSTATCCGKN